MSDQRHYFWKLRRASGSFVVDLKSKQWCDMHHEHFDWEGMGNNGRPARVRHLNAHLRALRRAHLELSSQDQPYQIFALIDLDASEDDAVFIHTPNPHGSEFPVNLCATEISPEAIPPILSCRIDSTRMQVLKSSMRGSRLYYVVPRLTERPAEE